MRVTAHQVLATVLSACAADAAAAGVDRYEITGTVRDARTQQPVEHAAVHFISEVLDEADANSDSAGRFSLSAVVRQGVSFGHLTASHEGYAAAIAHSVYLDDAPHVLTIELLPQAKQ
jgi:hypothetical protein